MPLARIILAGLNVLMALVLAVLAARDWGTRQAWQYAVYRHDLALHGLPVDETERDVEGEPLVNQVTEATAKQLFPANPVRTQKEEAEARQRQLAGEIDGLDDAAKRQRLLGVLKALARTGAERDALDARPTEELRSALDEAFRSAKDARGEGDYLRRRIELAHLLFNLSDDPQDQHRAMLVVGARAFSREVDAQAQAMHEAAERVQHLMSDDLAQFSAQYQKLLQRVIASAERVADLKATLQAHKQLTEKHQVIIGTRNAEIKEYQAKLAATAKETEQALAEQAKLEAELFAAQRRLGEAYEKNQQLEREIRAKELGR